MVPLSGPHQKWRLRLGPLPDDWPLLSQATSTKTSAVKDFGAPLATGPSGFGLNRPAQADPKDRYVKRTTLSIKGQGDTARGQSGQFIAG